MRIDSVEVLGTMEPVFIETIDELHDCFYDTLNAFDNFCNANNIEYQIMWGTLLGAVRNKDFISWDDDVDVILFRKDYDKLCALSSKCPQGYMVAMPGDDNIFFDFTPRFINTAYIANRFDFIMDENIPQKIFNPGIDLFVLDSSYRGIRHKIHWCRKMYYYALARAYRPFFKEIKYKGKTNVSLRLFGKIGLFLGKLSNLNNICFKFNVISKKCHNNRGFVFNSNGEPKGIAVLLRSEWFSSTTFLTIRDKQFPAPAGYDELLKSIYGNYLDIPPLADRHPFHYNVTYVDNQKSNE